MSFLYDPRTRKPQIWTYPVFVGLALAVFYGFYSYGEKKSRANPTVEQNVVDNREF